MRAMQHILKPSKNLIHSLSRIYGERVNQILKAIGSIGPRYYIRVNTLLQSSTKLIEDMRSNRLEAFSDKEVEDALYLCTRETRIESQDKIVQADLFAAEAILQGAHLYAAGVRNCQGLRVSTHVSVTDPNGITVGSGESLQDETSILTYRKGIAVKISENPSGLPSLMETPWYASGQIYLQSLPAIVVGHVLDPQPGDVIVDLNCAPGGKMSHICQLTQNKARVLGFDRSTRKLERTKQTLDRLKCQNCSLILHDSRYVHIDYSLAVDKVLVDPPCSALGVTPKLSINKDTNNIRDLAAYQRQFLLTASKIVKPGGFVVYSVCTITFEECEEIVGFAESDLGLKQIDAGPFIGGHGLDLNGMSQRFDPVSDGCGYFIAKFVKI
jgi:16S rRNA (cytosine967-C5)-methyltransferase